MRRSAFIAASCLALSSCAARDAGDAARLESTAFGVRDPKAAYSLLKPMFERLARGAALSDELRIRSTVFTGSQGAVRRLVGEIAFSATQLLDPAARHGDDTQGLGRAFLVLLDEGALDLPSPPDMVPIRARLIRGSRVEVGQRLTFLKALAHRALDARTHRDFLEEVAELGSRFKWRIEPGDEVDLPAEAAPEADTPLRLDDYIDAEPMPDVDDDQLDPTTRLELSALSLPGYQVERRDELAAREVLGLLNASSFIQFILHAAYLGWYSDLAPKLKIKTKPVPRPTVGAPTIDPEQAWVLETLAGEAKARLDAVPETFEVIGPEGPVTFSRQEVQSIALFSLKGPERKRAAELLGARYSNRDPVMSELVRRFRAFSFVRGFVGSAADVASEVAENPALGALRAHTDELIGVLRKALELTGS